MTENTGASRRSREIDVKSAPPPEPRLSPVGLPVFKLKGGPYDGFYAQTTGDGFIDQIAFSPDVVHVRGREGYTVYSIDPPGRKRDAERTATFSEYA